MTAATEETMSEKRRQKIIETVYDEYQERIAVLLSQLRAALQDAGYLVGAPVEEADEEYRWYMAVDGDNLEAMIQFTILEEAVHEGGHPPGINFSMEIIGEGARVLGQWTPYNYTDRCWVDARDRDAVEQRWEYFSTIDLSGAVEIINNR